MSAVRIVREAGKTERAGQEIKAQLAEYMAQQPASKLAFHKWMRVLETASLGLIAGTFALAMVVSINHTTVPGTTIAAAWFAFPVSVMPLMILQGLHTIVLRASLPSVLTGKPRRFVTGSKAVGPALGSILVALVVGVFWGAIAWAVWAGDMALVERYVRILGAVLGVAIPVAIVAGLISSLYRQFVRAR